MIGIISALLWRLPNGASLSGYISFAASIASLVLALVAIFQALLSSQGLEASILEIKLSAASIVNETGRLGAASGILNREAETAIRKLESLPDLLTSMKGELSERISEIRDQSFAKLSSEGIEAQEASSVEDCSGWYKGKPFGYIIAIYMLALSNKTYHSFDTDKAVSEERYPRVAAYAFGVITVVKHHKIYSIDVDGTTEFLARSMGLLDCDQVLADVRAMVDVPETVGNLRAELDKYFEVEVSEVAHIDKKA